VLRKKHTVWWAIGLLKKAGFKQAAAFLEAKRHSNPAPVDPAHPKAPPSHKPDHHGPHPHPNPQDPLSRKIVSYANSSLAYAGKMNYTETAARSQLFYRNRGQFGGASADCSQYCAAILHWLGVKSVTSTDYTGTLLQKGKPLRHPRPGCVAIWGPGTGAHAAFVTEHIKGTSDWYCVGFGHQGAPDRNTLSGMNAYFDSVGQPGVRFLSFVK
jgi:hypothetical protein